MSGMRAGWRPSPAERAFSPDARAYTRHDGWVAALAGGRAVAYAGGEGKCGAGEACVAVRGRSWKRHETRGEREGSTGWRRSFLGGEDLGSGDR